MIKDTLCIIPARSGSKGIKDKNILKLGNYPLIRYSIEFAKKLKFVKKIVVSSNSKKYLKIAKKYGINSLKLRPTYLSKDNSKTIEVVRFEYGQHKSDLYKKILILQPTCPFRKLKDFYDSNYALNISNYDSAITVHKISEYPQRMLKKEKKNFIPFLRNNNKHAFQPRQKINNLYIRTGSMYLFKIKNLNKENFLGSKIYAKETFGRYQINIDTKKDLILAKYYFNDICKNQKS